MDVEEIEQHCQDFKGIFNLTTLKNNEYPIFCHYFCLSCNKKYKSEIKIKDKRAFRYRGACDTYFSKCESCSSLRKWLFGRLTGSLLKILLHQKDFFKTFFISSLSISRTFFRRIVNIFICSEIKTKFFFN